MNAREREAQFQRRQSAADWAEESGGYTPTSFKSPQGIKPYKLSDGIQAFDVIPFLASSVQFRFPKADPGQPIWNRTYGRHKIPGPNGKDVHYLCLAETFDRPCPFCKKQQDRSLDKITADYLKAQKRLVMLVNDKPGDPTNPLKILNAAYYNRDVGFGQQLRNAINMNRPSGDYFYDWDRQDGRTLRVMVTDEKWAKVGSIAMVSRNYDYSYSIVENAPCLDDCFIVPRPADLENVPLADLTDEDWLRVYNEMAEIVGGEIRITPQEDGQNQREEPPQQELPAVATPRLASPSPSQQREKEREKEREKASPTPERGRPPEEKAPERHVPAPSPTKPSCPYKIGDRVIHHDLICEVKAIEGGRLLTILDEDGDLYEDVPFAAVKPAMGKKIEGKNIDKSAPPPASTPSPTKQPVTAGARKGLDDDDLDSLDEDEND